MGYDHAANSLREQSERASALGSQLRREYDEQSNHNAVVEESKTHRIIIQYVLLRITYITYYYNRIIILCRRPRKGRGILSHWCPLYRVYFSFRASHSRQDWQVK